MDRARRVAPGEAGAGACRGDRRDRARDIRPRGAGLAAASPLPDAFYVVATVAAESDRAIARGAFRVLLQYVDGPPGALMLGRFCHADQTLHEFVRAQLQAEEAIRPEQLFAEIVHLPDGRTGNVVCRPVLRQYEIPYLGRSGAPADRQIPVTDLLVSVRNNRIVLRSRRLGREVVPRLHPTIRTGETWACTASCAGSNTRTWCRSSRGTGALEDAPPCPGRERTARAVPRCWNVTEAELRSLGQARGAEQFVAVQSWRERQRLLALRSPRRS